MNNLKKLTAMLYFGFFVSLMTSVILQSANAQNNDSIVWAPDGAVWYYSHPSHFPPEETFIKIERSGDTIINSQNVKVLSKYIDTNQFVGKEYTFRKNGVVYLYINSDFDTLYNLKAKPGDYWHLNVPEKPNSDKYLQCDDSIKVQVTDTNTTTVNNNILKQLVVEYDLGWKIVSDTITQAIGGKNFLLVYDTYCRPIDAGIGGPLRCYQDNQIGTFSTNEAPYCRYRRTVGMNNDEMLQNDIEIRPNPSTGMLSLKLPVIRPTNATLKIYNLNGKIAYTNKIAKLNKIINLENELDSGLYLVSLLINNNIIYKKKIIFKL